MNIEINKYIIHLIGRTSEVIYDNIWRRCQYTSLIPRNKKTFEVREDVAQQSDKKGGIFHSGVEKLFFILKSSRPDLETATSLLATVVSKRYVDDWVKF